MNDLEVSFFDPQKYMLWVFFAARDSVSQASADITAIVEWWQASTNIYVMVSDVFGCNDAFVDAPVHL